MQSEIVVFFDLKDAKIQQILNICEKNIWPESKEEF
jgi:hypothetical protein